MAGRDDLFYRPHIEEPERERIPSGDTTPELLARKRVAEELGIREEDVVDPLLSIRQTFEVHETNAKEIRNRATFLLDKTIENIDSYVGDIPPEVLQMITDLTGIYFPEDTTDSVYTLPKEVMQCIFRSAGYYDPVKHDIDIVNNTEDLEDMKEELTELGKIKKPALGLKLIKIVIKLCYITIVHYTIGHLCARVRTFNPGVKIPKPISKTISFSLGKKMADNVIRPVQEGLLRVAGYRCNRDNEPPVVDCNEIPMGQDIEFERVPCCSNTNIFPFADGVNDAAKNMEICIDTWLNRELGTHATTPDMGRICSPQNAENINEPPPTETDIAKAKIVSDNLMSLPHKSKLTSSSDIAPLKSAIQSSDTAIMLAQHTQNTITSSISMASDLGDAFSCFGRYGSPGGIPIGALYMPKSQQEIWELPYVEEGNYATGFFKNIDLTLKNMIENADKIVTSTANLMKWTSSREICCWVYMIVMVTSVTNALINSRGNICDGIESKSEALINEFKWASSVKGSAGVEKAILLLETIKTIIDIFNRKSKRLLFLEGFTFHFAEMLEIIKYLISTSVAQYLDLLFSPLDEVLTGIQGVPELRHMTENECFGINHFLSFLQCLLGNLKFGLINEILRLLDFSMKDRTLISDIYLSRQRSVFMEALSDLIQRIIDLILELKDCYEPGELIDKTIDQQRVDQYNKLQEYLDLFGPDSEYADKISNSLLGQSVTYTPEEIEELDNLDGSISSKLQGMGKEAIMILAKEIPSFDTKEYKMTEYVGEDGKLLDIGTVNKIIEEQTGITHKQTKESMERMLAVLQGTHRS